MKKTVGIIAAVCIIIVAAVLLIIFGGKKNSENKAGLNPQEKKTETTEKEPIRKVEKSAEEKEKDRTAAAEKLSNSSEGVAIINDIVISQEYYNYMYIAIYKDMENQFSEQFGEDWLNEETNGMTVKEYIKLTAEEQLKRVVAVNIIAKDYGFTPDSEEIKTAVKQKKEELVKELGGQSEYDKFVSECKSNDEAVMLYIEQFEIYDKTMTKLQSLYDEQSKNDAIETFNNEIFKVQYIFVSTEELIDAKGNQTTQKSDSEALFVANTVIERLNSGEDFNEMVDVYNEDASMQKDSYHTIDAENADKAVYDAAKELKPGTYTKTPVPGNNGYYVIKRYAVDENDDSFKSYYGQESGAELYDVIQNQIDNMPVIFKYNVIDPYINSWIEELQAK